jgi:hypothetical protein
MAINYHGKKVLKPWSMVVNLKTAVIYHGTLALENESTAGNYRIIFKRGLISLNVFDLV